MIFASSVIGVKVVMDLPQRILDGRRISDGRKTSVIVAIYEANCDMMSYTSYKRVKLLDHAIKIVERMLERRIQTLINLHRMHLRITEGNRRVNAAFFVRRTHEEYQNKEKHFIGFCWYGKGL